MVFRDELVGLLASLGTEGNEGDRAFYLEGLNGTGSFNIDRIGRGSLFVKTLCLSVFGGIQPELLERYLASIVNSLDNDGRIQRFQVLVYPEPVAWEWRDRYPVKGAREAVRDLFDRLAEFDPLQDGADTGRRLRQAAALPLRRRRAGGVHRVVDGPAPQPHRGRAEPADASSTWPSSRSCSARWR